MKQLKKKKKDASAISFFKTAIPVASAFVVILAAAGFIGYKLFSAYLYNERWKDYDECGMS